MSSKKITKWIDKQDYKTCFKIVQKYYANKEQGKKVYFHSKEFRKLIINRFFLIFISLFRFNRNPYKKYVTSENMEQFILRLFGVYKLEIPNLLSNKPIFTPLSFKQEDQPLVSIIIAVHNHFNYTYNCLHSILLNTKTVSYEIILVNDYSSDCTADLIKKIENITYIENEENLGFLRSCNKAAKLARGKYLCFLNNDTQVMNNWLAQMLSVFDTDLDTGLVGAKLIFPYGLLQEAGGLVNFKGEPGNYGRLEAPGLNRFNYLRQTDYCSGACILLTTESFNSLGGFDEQYAPAYYEDTDLCMAITHKLGKKVYYQPLAEIIHFEGISSGKIIKAGSVKEYQFINAVKFKQKWADVLTSFPKTTSSIEIAEKFDQKKTILLIDVILPEHDKASGYKRLFELTKIFKSLSYNIILLPHDGEKREPYYSELVNLGIRIVTPSSSSQGQLSVLEEIIDKIDIAWISRPELNEYYAHIIKKSPKILWIYDTIDLHFIREERGLKLQNELTAEAMGAINSIMKKEIQLSKEADITIAITETEADILVARGAKKVITIPNIHFPYKGPKIGFNERAGICFIGGYQHHPNIDAVLWLALEIMPIIWNTNPDIKLTIMGSHPTPEILALQSNNINVTGYLEDVTDHFTTSRIFVAPLRYGAGMKGKIGQSLEFGLPVITTDIGAEGMNLQHDHDVLIANTTEEFADQIIRIYFDENLWNTISFNSTKAIEQYAPSTIAKTIKELFND
jgi:GT2 family glycosyltransferase